MATDHIERPTFSEGAYLGAADLTAAVEHARVYGARHALGGHVWGIAIGLDLEEREVAATGGIEVFIEPGYAWDGFGRPIVMLAPCQLPEDALRDLTCPAGSGTNGCLVNVWLRYHEEQTAGPRPGFERCNGETAYSRVRETFQIEVGDRASSRQRDRITVAGGPILAEEALQALNPARPLIHDASIPFQALPVRPTATWLIPLGCVRWQPGASPGAPGKFVKREDDDKLESRKRRRYIGVVAEGLYAADGSLRVRRRNALPEPEWSDDLLWVEGDSRLQGDASLWGKTLAFVDDQGDDDGAPLRFQRGGVAGARLLEAVTGVEAEPNHALAIGPASTADPDAIVPRVVVKSGGQVGVGTTTPAELLHVRRDGASLARVVVENQKATANAGTRLTLRQMAGEALEIGFVNTGNQPFQSLEPGSAIVSALQGAKALAFNHQGAGPITFNTDDWHERMRITQQGNVGIGTTTPADLLHVRRDDGAPVGILIENPAAAANAGTRLTLRETAGEALAMGFINNGNAVFRSLEPGSAFVAALEGATALAFNHQGAGPITFSTEDWHERVRITPQGNVGIGTTAPNARLHVAGGDIRWGQSRLQADQGGSIELGGDSLTAGTGTPYIDFHFGPLAAQDFNARIINDADGLLSFVANRVQVTNALGIGTSTPQSRLEVRGDIRLGPDGDHYAVAGIENLRVIHGTIDANGSVEAGLGFSVDHYQTGYYLIDFTDDFPSLPSAAVTQIYGNQGAGGDTRDNAVITAIFNDRFEVQVGASDGTPDDRWFSFIVVGPRS